MDTVSGTVGHLNHLYRTADEEAAAKAYLYVTV